MSNHTLRRLVLVASALSLSATGCSTPQRLPAVPRAEIPQATTGLGQVRYLVSRETATFAADAAASMEREKAWLASQGKTGPLPPAYFLAISGGGDNGAFGAGLLNGWTAAGTRPEFKLVTGVSTGALIAPFAFLGPKYDHVIESVYTQTSQKDIFKKRSFIKGLFGDAMADTSPLAATIASYVNQPLLDEIAAEYAKGRVLLVGTANLDSLEPVIWNMTAIAANKDPRSLALFRQILRASAAIPGAFPPMMINVDVDGRHYQEMHVDGGTMAQVFLFPPSLTEAQVIKDYGRTRVVYIIRNARLDADWASVERRTLPIASRAIGSLMTTQGVGDLYRIFTTTEKDEMDFNLAYIPPSFDVPHKEEFDTNYMRQLYATGRQMAVGGYQWQKYPPGYKAPLNMAKPASK
jgi:predicted acylesterase/phospholipase RssA